MDNPNDLNNQNDDDLYGDVQVPLIAQPIYLPVRLNIARLMGLQELNCVYREPQDREQQAIRFARRLQDHYEPTTPGAKRFN